MVQMISESKRKIAALALAGAMAIGGAAGVATTIASPAQNQSGIVMEAEAASMKVTITTTQTTSEAKNGIKYTRGYQHYLTNTANSFNMKVSGENASKVAWFTVTSANKDKISASVSGTPNANGYYKIGSKVTISAKTQGTASLTFKFYDTNGKLLLSNTHKDVTSNHGKIKCGDLSVKVGEYLTVSKISITLEDSKGNSMSHYKNAYTSKRISLGTEAAKHAIVYDSCRDCATVKGLSVGSGVVTVSIDGFCDASGNRATCKPTLKVIK